MSLETPAATTLDEAVELSPPEPATETTAPAVPDAPTPAAESPEPAPAPEAEAPAAPAEEPAPAAPETDAQYPTFSYHGENQAFTIPGSALGEDGLFIPTAAIPELRQLLASGRAASGSMRRSQVEQARALDRAKAEITAAVTARDQVFAAIERMVEAKRQGNPQPLEDFLAGVETQWPVLKAQAEKAALQRQYDLERESREGQERERREAEQIPLMQSRLAQAVQHFSQQVGLPVEHQERVFERLLGQLDRIFPKAEQDGVIPGVKKGDRLEDLSQVEQEIRWLAGLLPKPTSKPVTQQPPPSVAARRGPAPSGRPKPPALKTTEDALRFLEEGDLDAFVPQD